MEIRSKLSDVGLTIFSVMTGLANEHNAINLSQGFPDFDVAPGLIDLVARHMRSGHNQYAPMQGVMALRETIALKVEDLYGEKYDPDTEITVTAGATEALFCAVTTVVNPGDEVIVFEPAYDAYVPAIWLSGGVPVFLELTFPQYRIDWDAVHRAVTPKTRLMILNSPHNPSGTVLTPRDMDQLKRLVRDTGIIIISDEVYEHIAFEGQPHESLSRYPELARRSFVISSMGKTYHTTGWKIGYVLAPAKLSEEFRKVHQYVTFASNTPVQYAYAEFMRDASTYLPLADFYQQKRDLFLSMTAESRFHPISCMGTYFLLLDYSDITDEPDTAFARRLIVENGVAAVPPSVFYNRPKDYKVLRFCFAKKDETLRAAAQRLCEV